MRYAPMVAALVTMLVTILLITSKTGKEIQDIPNERSLHDTPVPRIGGLGILAGIGVSWALMLADLAWWVVLPTVLLAGFSFIDDVRGLPVRARLLVQFGAALIFLFGSGLAISHEWLALPLLLAVVWMTNLYNFMDGSDGLAGGMALFGFSFYAVAALMAGHPEQAMLNFSIGAAALGFLYYNFHPAKVFMGDAGSISLGFLAAAMGLSGWQQGFWPLWFPLLAFAPFWVDATVTLVKRSLRGEKVTEAHRDHYYQRLIRLGVGHDKVAIYEYGLMLISGASALWALRQSAEVPWLLLMIGLPVYAGIMLWIDQRWKQFNA